MSFTQHLGPICKGAGIGFLFGLASVATIDKASLFVLRIGTKPVEGVVWLSQKLFGLSDGSTALMGWACAAVYWMILGGLIGWGVGLLRSKMAGDE